MCRVVAPKPEQPWKRAFPFCLLPDAIWYAYGLVIVTFIALPSLSFIAITTITYLWILLPLYNNVRWVHSYATYLHGIMSRACVAIAPAILADSRDSGMLPWILYNTIFVPTFFLCVAYRYVSVGHMELSTFLLYHFLRLGPRYRAFAYHHVLIHKEGHSRRGLFRGFSRDNWFMRHFNQIMAAPLYGAMPLQYPTAHTKIHHAWHNDLDDCSTTGDLDRSRRLEFVLYLTRFSFYWANVLPLAIFLMRREYQLAKKAFFGIAYYVSFVTLCGTLVGWSFTTWFVLYPLAEATAFLGSINYLQHAFINPANPTCQYVNSVTIVDGKDNIMAEDFHVVHHHAPHVHWTDVPAYFEKTKDKYRENKATIFGDCEQGQLLLWMLVLQDWDTMARHFVDLDTDNPSTHEEKKALILERLRFRVVTGGWSEWSRSETRNWDNGKHD